MRSQLGFVGEWWVATVVGVIVGTFLGANKVGLVQHVPGDFLFGLAIGAAQYVVLYRHLNKRDNRLLLWIAASAIAFPISVVLGRRSVSFFMPGPDMLDFCFGIGMGLGHGLFQAAAMRLFLPSAGWRFLIWIPIAIIAWVASEVISLGINYTLLLSLPVGLSLGIVEAIGWLFIFKPNREQSTGVSVPFATTDQSSG